MKNIFFFIAASLACQTIIAQLPDYYVYLTYGDIWIQQHGNKSVKIKPKQLINASDVIEIKDTHSEIELVDRDDNFIVFSTKGLYPADHLKSKTTQKTEGLTKKYLRLVWEAISHSSSDFDIYKNESVAASWGGGARSKDCSIEKFPPGHSFFSGDTLIFKWKNKDTHNTYRFSLYDSSNNAITELLVRDTQLILLLRSQSLGEYYWSIDPLTYVCHDIQKNKFTLMSKEQEDSITASLIKKIPPNKDDVLYNLQISDALGNKGYIDKALEYFNKSWELYNRR